MKIHAFTLINFVFQIDQIHKRVKWFLTGTVVEWKRCKIFNSQQKIDFKQCPSNLFIYFFSWWNFISLVLSVESHIFKDIFSNHSYLLTKKMVNSREAEWLRENKCHSSAIGSVPWSPFPVIIIMETLFEFLNVQL